MFHRQVWNDDRIEQRFIHVIANNVTHPHKKHCEEVAKFWYKVITGLEQGCYAISYRLSLTDNQKTQRARLHIPESPALINKIRITLDEVNRCDDIITSFGDVKEEGKKLLVDNLENYCGEDSMDDYLDEEHINHNLTDPNAFLLNLHYPFNPTNEKPKPFPKVIHTCPPRKIEKEHKDGEKKTYIEEDHPHWRDYLYYNKNLTYLIYDDKQLIPCIEHNKEILKTTDCHYCYASGKSWKLTRIPDTAKLSDDDLVNESRSLANSDDARIEFLEPDANHIGATTEIDAKPRIRTITNAVGGGTAGAKGKYLIEVWESKIEQIPARQWGWRKDLVTRGETFESPLFPAKGYFIDLIQTKAELAVVKATQGFARFYQYVPKCNHREPGENKVCTLGKIGNRECPKCKGTGKKKFHTAPEDMITFEMIMDNPPRDDKMIDLSKLMHAEPIPKEAIDLIKECFDDIKKNIINCLFASNLYEQGQIVNKTATEIQHNKGPINNFLSKVAKAKARMAKFIIETTAAYMDFDCDYSRIYPSNFKLHSVSELLIMRKQAVDAGAPSHIIQSIDRDIMQKQNRDNVELQQSINVREIFRPFSDLTQAEKIFALGQLSATDEKKILYLCFDEIFNEIDNNSKYQKFYTQEYDAQKTIIDELVKEHKDRISENKEESQVAAFGAFSLNENEEEDEPTDEQ